MYALRRRPTSAPGLYVSTCSRMSSKRRTMGPTPPPGEGYYAPEGAPYAVLDFTFLATGFWVEVLAGTEPFRFSRSHFHVRRIGLAMYIDEYVPTMMPTTSTNENGLRASPPNRKSARTVSQVRPEVMSVRLSVWLIDALMTVARSSLVFLPRRFSRM